MNLLLIEDEERLVASLTDAFRTAGITVTHARTGRDGLAAALAHDFDLVLLDIGLPDQEGFTVLRRIRAAGNTVPVIILTARTSAEDTVRGLERGADDYMAKPFSLDELLARIRLRARRLPDAPTDPTIEVGRAVLDPHARVLTWEGDPVQLSPREFQLAQLLIERAGMPVTRAQALDHVWGSAARDNVLDVYIRYLRGRLAADAIETVRGVGYVFRG